MTSICIKKVADVHIIQRFVICSRLSRLITRANQHCERLRLIHVFAEFFKVRESMAAVNKFHCAAIHHGHLHWKLAAVVFCIQIKSEIDLLEVAHAYDSSGAARTGMCWQQHRSQNSNHTNNHQQFNQRKSAGIRPGRERFHGCLKCSSKCIGDKRDFAAIMGARAACPRVHQVSKFNSRTSCPRSCTKGNPTIFARLSPAAVRSAVPRRFDWLRGGRSRGRCLH